MANRMFGTDGVRGVPGEPPLDSVTIARLGVAIVEDLRPASAGSDAPRIVCGRDTRDSGAWIEAQLAAGIRAAGGAPGSSPAAPVSAPPSLLEHAIASAATNNAMIPNISANLRRIIYCLQYGYLGLVSTRVIAYSGPSACGKLSAVDSR